MGPTKAEDQDDKPIGQYLVRPVVNLTFGKKCLPQNWFQRGGRVKGCELKIHHGAPGYRAPLARARVLYYNPCQAAHPLQDFAMLLTLSRLLDRLSSIVTIVLAILVYGYFLSTIMPAESAASMDYAGEWGSPDRHFLYTPDELYEQLAGWGDEGRARYISFRLGLDIVWALAYTAFLVTITSVALRRAFAADDARRKLNLAPLIPLLSDYSENALGIWLVSSYPDRMDGVAQVTSWVTALKWTSLGVAHGVMIYALVAALIAVIYRRPKLS